MNRGGWQFEQHVVRQQQSPGAQHRGDVGERKRLLERVVIDEHVRCDDEIERLVGRRGREPFQHHVDIARFDRHDDIGTDRHGAHVHADAGGR